MMQPHGQIEIPADELREGFAGECSILDVRLETQSLDHLGHRGLANDRRRARNRFSAIPLQFPGDELYVL